MPGMEAIIWKRGAFALGDREYFFGRHDILRTAVEPETRPRLGCPISCVSPCPVGIGKAMTAASMTTKLAPANHSGARFLIQIKEIAPDRVEADSAFDGYFPS
jgi:hypothetical protein